MMKTKLLKHLSRRAFGILSVFKNMKISRPTCWFCSDYFTSVTGRVVLSLCIKAHAFQIRIYFLSMSWCVHIVYFIFITNYKHTVRVIGTHCVSNANNADVIIQKINSCSLPFVCSFILVFEFCSFFAISVDFPLRFFHYTCFFSFVVP